MDTAGVRDNSCYAASKRGLKGLSSVISEEGIKYNISATHISLGAIYSSIWEGRQEFSKNDMLNVEYVAKIISYIANQPASIRMDQIEITPPKKIL